ncbi:hypothetical protein SEA_ROBSFEET_82 [Microbacterium phage RobsFeet]|uniref:Uncharacterized protein n=1 Tax=Microbacterium phage RobsFeet TaxID=2201442 RepID=A0A2Z4Q9F4_9CAUD|nr:hypothetical protein HOT43_gp84 [Microbacterium phage RobsFeet]AWY06088.1 hypothetical protein SEA_ROBSFEET_82 [Microbacterium phage RobsFeet]
MTGTTFRDGKVHVMAEKCAQCAFTTGRIVDGARVASIVRETKDVEGAHFICHLTTIAADGDAICAGWMEHLGDRDPLLRLAEGMGIIERVEQPKGTP